jgi:hypothetical protein
MRREPAKEVNSVRKLLPSLLIAIMALSVLSCAGVVSAAPNAAPQQVSPQLLAPKPYVIPFANNTLYTWIPGQYNVQGASSYETPTHAVGSASINSVGTMSASATSAAGYANINQWPYNGYGADADVYNGVWVQLNVNTTVDPYLTPCTVYVTVQWTASVAHASSPTNTYAELGSSSNNYGYVPWYDTSGNGHYSGTYTVVYSIPIEDLLLSNSNIQGYIYSTSAYGGTVSAQGQVTSISVQF